MSRGIILLNFKFSKNQLKSIVYTVSHYAIKDVGLFVYEVAYDDLI